MSTTLLRILGLSSPLALVALSLACASPASTDAGPDTRASTDAADDRTAQPDTIITDTTPGNDAGESGSSTCPPPASVAPSVPLVDFESGAIPTSDTDPRGFRGGDVARGTVISPGAHGTAHAARFSFATDTALFFQSRTRPVYFDGSQTYHPDLANALAFDLRIPAGNPVLSASGGPTLGVWSYNWNPADPWIGSNPTGGNLTDSQMHGYGNMRFDPSGADRWIHVVMSSSAFQVSRGNYHLFAARAIAGDLTFFGTVRQFEFVLLGGASAGASLDMDEVQLVTLAPTAQICPGSLVRTATASGGDIREPVEVVNPTDTARTYRVFISSVIGADRQTLEVAMHDTDSVAAIDDLQGAVGSDGSVGAVELFAVDAAGMPAGGSVIPAGAEITLAPHAAWRGALVHHVTPGMLGPVVTASTGGRSYMVRRDTLTTSVIVWDPHEPRRGDAAVVFTGSNSDSSHPAPPGFPTYRDPPAGWRSSDVPPDQVGAYFTSILRLTP
ncbi:MAG: hypothetical protein WCJ30_00045 [Deltaproteobacteria bacterium]